VSILLANLILSLYEFVEAFNISKYFDFSFIKPFLELNKPAEPAPSKPVEQSGNVAAYFIVFLFNKLQQNYNL